MEEKMKKLFLFAAMMLATVSFTTSCSSDDGPSQSTVNITCSTPSDIEILEVSNLKITFTDVTSGKSQSFNLPRLQVVNDPTFVVTEGLYDIDVEGDATYMDGMEKVSSVIRANKKGVSITGDAFQLSLDGYVSKITSGFVFSELFFAGTVKPDGDRYQDDAYIRITNNSDVTLYADGLFIAESEFQSDMNEYDTASPDVRNNATPVGYLTVLPGSGTDYPVAPGESILVAINAINHQTTELNPNSFDLTKANFEIFNESSRPEVYQDVDNPAVPNTKDVYTQSATVWTPHVRGVKSYIIGRLGVSADQWLTDYTYNYTYKFVFGEYSFDMDGEAMQVPNAWISDAVNVAPKDQYTYPVISATLDKGYAWYSEVGFDENRLGKGIRRKFADGKLVDTNDSSNDFESHVEANPFYVFK